MELRPLHDRIVIKRLDEGETMRGGIIIPDTAKEKPQQGSVIAVGNRRKSKPATASFSRSIPGPKSSSAERST